MNTLTDSHDQLIQEHAALIRLVVESVHDVEQAPLLDSVLTQAEENGWTALVTAIRKIVDGERNLSGLGELDEEDRHIVIAILRGIEDQTTLPDIAGVVDARKAAIQIAILVVGVRCGNSQAEQSLATMSAQMMSAGGDMAQVGAVLSQIVNGERQMEKLSYNMGSTGSRIVQNILEELHKREQ